MGAIIASVAFFLWRKRGTAKQISSEPGGIRNEWYEEPPAPSYTPGVSQHQSIYIPAPPEAGLVGGYGRPVEIG